MAHRIHITGGPGSGKTTLAQRLAAAFGVPFHELDDIWLATLAAQGANPELDLCRTLVSVRFSTIAMGETWLTEGAFIGGSEPLLQRSTVIVKMDVPWRVASFRIISRHVIAELRRNNRWPGWRRLAHFWNWSRRWYANINEAGFNDYGAPRTTATLVQCLAPYADKVIEYRTFSDLAVHLRAVAPEPSGCP